jgi:hypothetical protein
MMGRASYLGGVAISALLIAIWMPEIGLEMRAGFYGISSIAWFLAYLDKG